MTRERYDAIMARNRHTAPVAVELPPIKLKPKKNKYGNKKTVRHGITWDSEHEANCWDALKLREKAGEISFLQRQVSFPLTVGGVMVQRFRVDFWYIENGKVVIADAKSSHTASLNAWKRTKKLMLACYGLEVKEYLS